MKSPLLAATRRVLTLASRVTRIIVLFAYFFLLFFFMREKIMLRAPVRRHTATFLGYLDVPPSAYSFRRSIVNCLAIVMTQHSTSAEDLASCGDHLPKLRIFYFLSCLRELII